MHHSKKQQLIELKEQCYACKACGLCENFVGGKDPHVFSYGNINSSVVFVGMNPGKDEVEQKRPFVGKAGQLLDKLLVYAGIEDRKYIYISNVVRCYTIGLREPTPEERTPCIHFLQDEIKIIKPKLLVAMGNFALESLIGCRSIMSVHGKIHDTKYNDTPVFATLHPSAANRNGSNKPLLIDDFQKLKHLI